MYCAMTEDGSGEGKPHERAREDETAREEGTDERAREEVGADGIGTAAAAAAAAEEWEGGEEATGRVSSWGCGWGWKVPRVC